MKMETILLINELRQLYPSGTRVTNKDLKISLQHLYNKYGVVAVAKAVDIKRYGYTTRIVKIPSSKGRLNGVELNIISQ